MAMIRDLSSAQLAFQVQGRDVDEFDVLRYRGTEGLSQLYRFEIELACRSTLVTLNDLVGHNAVLSIAASHGKRYFHGIVSRFELTGEGEDQTYYRVELVPAVWLLTHRYNSRIFQDRTVPEIISDVLEAAGIDSDRFCFSLARKYASREYCVQYRETDYNFICRLMEEEGIWWCFEQSCEAHTLVMADDASAYEPIEGEAALPYHAPSGLNVPAEHIFRFRLSQCVRPGSVVLDDFNFENPKLDLQATGDNGRDGGLVFSDYPGEYTEQSRGQALAQLRAEEFESGRVRGIGQSTSHRLSPGRTFALTEYPDAVADGSYLVTTVTHQGKQSTGRTSVGADERTNVVDARLQQALSAARKHDDPAVRQLAEGILQIARRFQAGDQTANRALTDWLYHAGQVSRDLTSATAASGGNPLEALTAPNLLDDIARLTSVDGETSFYECRFECLPATVTFRPPRITPWPAMRGTQTARVTGPQNEEIYTDEYGRVKVQFNWDREGKFDENSSCWIRVSQGFAGGNYGMMFLPRVGQEVLVEFLEGDPDQPVITGRVYNADQMPPYQLPDEKTKSVIKTHSSKGGEGTNELRFEDLKGSEQILFYAQKDLHVRVNNDRVENIDHDHHLTVKQNKVELVKQSKSSEVVLDLKEKIGGSKSLKVDGDVGEEIGGSRSEDVSKNYYVKAGTNLVLDAGTNLTLKVGGNSIALTSAGIFISGQMVYINSGTAATPGQAISVQTPAAVLTADSVQPGKDVTYSREDELESNEVDPDAPGLASIGEGEDDEEESSWIEVELVDEAGQPVPGERYEITAPDGETVHRGALDRNGQAHVRLRESGNCQISFPNLDSAAWQRGGVVQAAPSSTGATSPVAGTTASATQTAPAVAATPAAEPTLEDDATSISLLEMEGLLPEEAEFLSSDTELDTAGDLEPDGEDSLDSTQLDTQAPPEQHS